jgi:hypothetical protein
VPGTGDQQIEQQQREQDLARKQRLGEQLHQLFREGQSSGAVATAKTVDSSIGAIVANARASASAALSSSGDVRHRAYGLQHAASALAGARASINEAKVAALREPEHGDLANLVQLDQQAASAQSAIINLLV